MVSAHHVRHKITHRRAFFRLSVYMQRSLGMPSEQDISVNVNSASSVENQTSATDKLERTSDEAELAKETPDTIRGQLAELFHALRTRDDSSRNFLLRVVQPGLAGVMGWAGFALAPLFGTAFATPHAFYAFLVWISGAAGAGVRIGFFGAVVRHCGPAGT